MSFTVRVTGDEAIRAVLRKWVDPSLRKRLQDATKAGATAFKAPMKAEAAQVSKRLARSVSVRKAARNTPATVVTFRPNVAFFRHFIIGGTKDHGPRKAKLIVFLNREGRLIRTRQVRGVRANPIPQRVFARMKSAASAAVEASLTKDQP